MHVSALALSLLGVASASLPPPRLASTPLGATAFPAPLSKSFETFYLTVPLDHSQTSGGITQFDIRYHVDDSNFDQTSASSPIMISMGQEGTMDAVRCTPDMIANKGICVQVSRGDGPMNQLIKADGQLKHCAAVQLIKADGQLKHCATALLCYCALMPLRHCAPVLLCSCACHQLTLPLPRSSTGSTANPSPPSGSGAATTRTSSRVSPSRMRSPTPRLSWTPCRPCTRSSPVRFEARHSMHCPDLFPLADCFAC